MRRTGRVLRALLSAGGVSRGRRIRLALGALLFAAGVTIFGIGVFSYVDGGDAPAPAVTSADEPTPTPTITATPKPASKPKPTPTPTPGPPTPRDIPYTMIIDKIGVNNPVVAYGLDAELVPQVPNNGGDIAWYDFSAVPGTGSNAVFAGHVNWNRAPAVFGGLQSLAVGDVIMLKAKNGTEITYKVSDNFLVDPADEASLKVMAATPTDTITLITCAGTWIPDPSEQLGGDYTNRVIVRATLVSVNSVAEPSGAAAGS